MKKPPKRKSQIAERVEARKGDVPGTDLEWDEVVREGGAQRDGDEEQHHDAVHGEHLVVGVRAEDLELGPGQLQADEQGVDAAHDEEHQAGSAVHDADLLVVDGEEPATPPGAALGSA